MPPSQANSPFRFKSPIGDDALLLEGFSGDERISKPFRYTLRLLAQHSTFCARDLVGKSGVISIRLADEDQERHIHGTISRMKLLEAGDDGMPAFEADLVPWLHYLTLSSDCRIFQNKTVPQIVEKVFQDRGFTDIEWRTTASYQPREYCVQYRESDFNFISRLLEEEGIFYYFRHEKATYTLVLADAPSAFLLCRSQSKFRMMPSTGGLLGDDGVFGIEEEFQLGTNKVSLTDYNFETPNNKLLSGLAGPDEKPEQYDFPGNYLTRDDGDRYTRLRLEEREVAINLIRGNGNARAFECGYRFNLADHTMAGLNREYTLLAVSHEGHNAGWRAGGPNAAGYTNTFEAIPAKVIFRPPLQARKPLIHGTQTAIVVGKSGEEIWTDKYGRVTVHFHWDREGKPDETSSCWIRVAQGWAGKNWGSIFIPRVGQEVVVSFLEGDPDRPLITGAVYNADQAVPYALPGEQTKSVVKSNSSKGGGGFNEIHFEDKKGGEEMFVHAEKDFNAFVKNDRVEKVLNTSHLIVSKDHFEEIGGDQHLHVTGDQNFKIESTVSLDAGAEIHQKAATNFALDAGQEVHLKAGMNLVIESGTTLTLKVGGSFINLQASGIFIKGPMVNINSGGGAGSGAGASPHKPRKPLAAHKAEPGRGPKPLVHTPFTPPKLKHTLVTPAAAVLKSAAKSGAPFCDI